MVVLLLRYKTVLISINLKCTQRRYHVICKARESNKKKSNRDGGNAQRGAIKAIIDSISFSISRDFRCHYREEVRSRTLDSSPSAFSIHFPHNPFHRVDRDRASMQGGTHAMGFP